jgi:hypothetical protein
MKTTTRKNCSVSKRCSSAGRKLRKEHSTSAGKRLNSLCKPEKKARKKRGCLSGTSSKANSKSYVEVTVRIPKSKLK